MVLLLEWLQFICWQLANKIKIWIL